MDLELADGAEAEGEEEESLEAKNARVEELCKPADPEMPENKTCAQTVLVQTVSSSSLLSVVHVCMGLERLAVQILWHKFDLEPSHC